MSIAMVVGDVHIGGSTNIGKPGIGHSLNSRISDQISLLEWILSTAIDSSVSDMFLTGDVFEDPKPHPSIITLFIEWLKKCSSHNIRVHIIIGNHDVLRSGQFYMSALDIISAADISGIFVYKNIDTIDLDGMSFTLIPFRDRRSFNTDSNAEAIEKLKEKLPYQLYSIPLENKKIVIGHISIEGSIPVGDEIDDMSNELYCPVDMFNGYDYVWMGHVHKPQVLSECPTRVAHIGSMDFSNFSEAQHKKQIIILDTKDEFFFKELTLPNRPLVQVNIDVPSDIKDTTSYIISNIVSSNNDFKKAIVRVNVLLNNPDTPTIDRPKIEEFILSLGAFSVFRICEERKISPIKKTSSIQLDNTVNTSIILSKQ